MKTFGPGIPEGSGPVGVGIDQSYSGFAVAAVNDSGYAVEVYKGKGAGVDRLIDIQKFLLSRLDGCSEYGIKNIAMEGYAPAAKFGANMSGELGAAVKLCIRNAYDIPVDYPLVVAPSTLKKYVTGKGNVQKQQVMLQTFKKWGVELTDDNAADAYGLARIAFGFADHKYEQDVIDMVHAEKE